MQQAFISSSLKAATAASIIRTLTEEKIKVLESSSLFNGNEEDVEICERQIKHLQHQQASLIQQLIQEPQKLVNLETIVMV